MVRQITFAKCIFFPIFKKVKNIRFALFFALTLSLDSSAYISSSLPLYHLTYFLSKCTYSWNKGKHFRESRSEELGLLAGVFHADHVQKLQCLHGWIAEKEK